MRKRSFLGILGLGLVGYGTYRYRRQFVGRWLGLSAPRDHVKVERGVQVPMPDGICLATDVYRPAGDKLYPTILIRTPYGRRSAGIVEMAAAFAARRFAERGYNVLVQDVRGRFDSGGRFEPFVSEASDGRTSLEWIARQPWFDGNLAMWGQSYLGYVQWAVAADAPSFLKAMAPSITGSRLPIQSFRDKVFGMDTLFRWVLELDAIDRYGFWPSLNGLLRFAFQDRFLSSAFKHLPLADADQVILGRPEPFYQEWLAHPRLEDPYWQVVVPDLQSATLDMEVHLIAGWYDIFLRESLEDYAILRSKGKTPYLTVGPWYHLHPDCYRESLRQGLAWFDATLKGDKYRLRDKPVRVYVMGGGGWQEMESWPPEARSCPFYLREAGCLSLQIGAAYSTPDTYLYDPANPTPAVGGPMMNLHAGQKDNRLLEARPDVLTYTTLPLNKDMDVVGSACLDLYIRSSREYTDFFGRLCDVYPDGRSINICDGLIRLEPGDGELQPDGSRRIAIQLWPTANRFRGGHCLRLQVSSGAHPRWGRNPGSGEPVTSATKLLAAQQTIYHDLTHPSALILPVI